MVMLLHNGIVRSKMCGEKPTTEKITRWQKPLFCASNLSRVEKKMYFIVSPKFLYDNKRQNLKIEIHCEFSLVNVFNLCSHVWQLCAKILKNGSFVLEEYSGIPKKNQFLQTFRFIATF
jgi:hypothetical protein